MSTRKGEAAKRRIVDAAWELSDRRGVDALLGGVTLREIGREVGMAPSAVGYHFPTMRQLALAMIDRHVELAAATEAVSAVERHLDELGEQSAQRDVASFVHAAAAANWAALTTPAEVNSERRQARCYAATADPADGERIARLLDRMTGEWTSVLGAAYRTAGQRSGLTTVAPFTFDELATVGIALAAGLVQQWSTEPIRVRDDLLPQVFVALTSAMLVEDPAEVTLDELGIRLTPHRAGRTDTGLDAEAAERVAGLVADGVDAVTLSQVASALDVEVTTLSRRFGTVHRLAALSFGRHLDAVVAAVEHRSRAGAAVSLTDGVVELARRTVAEPHAAGALAKERIACALLASDGRDDVDLCRALPFCDALGGPLDELLATTPGSSADLADLLVDTVLGYGATRPRLAPAAIAEVALRLVPVDF